MPSKINNFLLKLIMFCVVGIYSAPAWADNNQVETAPADSEQASIEQNHELRTEAKELGEGLAAKAKDARENFQ